MFSSPLPIDCETFLLNRKSERIPRPAKAGLRERLNTHLWNFGVDFFLSKI